MDRARLDIRDDTEYFKPKECDECGSSLKYLGLGEYMCEKCAHKMFDDYGKVRNYVENHPGDNVYTISEKTGVSKHIIKRMLEDKRFDLVDNKGIME